MQFSQKIAPCLWFDNQGEEAANFLRRHLQEFAHHVHLTLWKSGPGDAQAEGRLGDDGGVRARGQTFTALNGGPIFKFNEAISLQIFVDDQKELDYYWDRLTKGGDPKSHVCGWLKDKYGLSWQVVPKKMIGWWEKPDEKSQRAFEAMMHMGKLDIAALERAYNG